MIQSGTRRSLEAGAGEERVKPERTRVESDRTLTETHRPSGQFGKEAHKAIVCLVTVLDRNRLGGQAARLVPLAEVL